MKISEIFSSIEGESIFSGYLTTFIRTHGCNLRCLYCDSLWTLTSEKDLFGNLPYREMSIEEIMYEVRLLKNKHITFTGAEPLLQKDAKELIDALLKENYIVNIETNGSIDLENFIYFQNRDLSNLVFSMDWKTSCSGMQDKMLEKNLSLLRKNDALKFVVEYKDLDEMRNIIENHDIHAQIYISPVFGKIELKDIINYMKKYNLQQTRLQIQLHKIAYNPDMRGV